MAPLVTKGGLIGGGPEGMSQLKAEFDRHGETIDTLISSLDSRIQEVIGSTWQGPAAERFRNAWQTEFKKALTGLRAALGDAANEVAKRRDAIIQAGG